MAERRRISWVRKAKEPGATWARWTRLEAGPTAAARWSRFGSWLVRLVVVAFATLFLAATVYDVVRWENLRTRGRDARARVEDTETTSDDGVRLYGWVPALQDFVVVSVNHDGRHPIGSHIRVRYDPRDTSNAVAL